MCEGLLFDADFHFLLQSSLLLEFILAIKSVSKFKHWYRSWIPQHGGRGRSEILAFSQKMKTTVCQVDTNSRLAKCVTKKSKKLWCLCPKIEYFGISLPFLYYSLLGRVIDFPSRVRIVKKIPSTGRVASTRHSLLGTSWLGGKGPPRTKIQRKRDLVFWNFWIWATVAEISVKNGFTL